MPILCGLEDAAYSATAGNVLCNAFYQRTSAQLYPPGMLDPVQYFNGSAPDYSFDVGHFMTPISRGDLLLNPVEQCEWVDLNTSSFISVNPLVQYMTNKQVTASLSAYKGMGGAAQCTASQLPLVLPLQGLLLSGAVLYCFDVQGDIVVMTSWDMSLWANATDCGQIRAKRRFMLVLYGGAELRSADVPFQYMYTVEQAAKGQWEVTCTTRCFQAINTTANENLDRLYSLTPDGLPAFWPSISRCANGTLGTSRRGWVVSNSHGLQYSVEISKGLARGDYDDVLFPHFSTRSMGPLQGAANASNMLKLSKSVGPELCVLKPVQPTPGVDNDGSATLAKQSISSLLVLGTVSGYGAQNLPLIRQQINDMSGQFAPLTLAAAVNAAMTCVVGASSAIVFTLKIKFLKATSLSRLIIRVLVSVVEAGVLCASAIAAMWQLFTKGKACKTMQWVDSKKGASCVLEKCDHFVATTAKICGSADYLRLQWAVLGVSIILTTTLIMYRWHLAKGGSLHDWIEVEVVQLKQADQGRNGKSEHMAEDDNGKLEKV